MSVIRPARTSDSSAVLSLAKAFATSFTPQESAFQTSWRQILQDPKACPLVAEDEDQVMGYLLGFQHPTFYANGPVAWVEELMVSESHQKKGIGKALMDHFEGWAKRQNCVLVALATRRAAEFYKAIGYEESALYFRKFLA